MSAHRIGFFPRLRGHFYNWYDTQSLRPIEPLFISTVDSGNLAAALVAVKQYCAGAAREPLMSRGTLAGLRDHWLRLRVSVPPAGRTSSVMRLMSALGKQLRYEPSDLFCWESLFGEVSSLMARLREPLERAAGSVEERDPAAAAEVRYWYAALASRVEAGAADLYALAPWLEAPFEAEARALWNNPELADLIALLARVPSLGELTGRYRAIAREVLKRLDAGTSLHPAARAAFSSLLSRLDEASTHAARLLSDYERCGSLAARWVEEMDFAFLFDRRRKLLRIGYDAAAGKLDPSYYDLLASEARSAVFDIITNASP
jgi:cyclic beta-1,2-glucan synthetase